MLKGSCVALVTPMTSSGEVDWDALERLIDWHLESGTHGIVPVGTTGESATLTPVEHKRVIEVTVEHVDGRIPVIAGTGANSTAEAIELTDAAKTSGADACLLVTPYYNKPTQEGLYRHYCAIADAVDIPMVLYNVPPRTACDMQPETVARLAYVEQIIGIKEACGDAERVGAIR
ncbi:MAG: 4-hydroxy-tetrahydrodipicolinate synthase, partial [Pseudomonadota bacterium]|nr:4-hydroxy-tetrahydrodipicolinate synthase [Pseudomonadota bacterium]